MQAIVPIKTKIVEYNCSAPTRKSRWYTSFACLTGGKSWASNNLLGSEARKGITCCSIQLNRKSGTPSAKRPRYSDGVLMQFAGGFMRGIYKPSYVQGEAPD